MTKFTLPLLLVVITLMLIGCSLLVDANPQRIPYDKTNDALETEIVRRLHNQRILKRSSEELTDDGMLQRMESGNFRMGFGKRAASDAASFNDQPKIYHMGFGKRALPPIYDEEDQRWR